MSENSGPVESQPVEHQNVPQAHRGLHDFLYSSNDEHSVETSAAPISEQAVEAVLEVKSWCDQIENAKVAGVYTVLDCDRQPQYIGYSRNIVLSLRSHLIQKGAETCAFVRVQPFKFPKRDAMEQLREEWIAMLPSPPTGNLEGGWEDTVKDAAAQIMSPAEREVYEAKKLKLRHAMADDTLSRTDAQTIEEGIEKRQALKSAVSEDNWSAMIREQTQDTQQSP